MKHVIALFLVAMTLQPVAAATPCAMDGDHDPSPHASMHHGDANQEQDRDCCNPDSDDPMPGCESTAPCASGLMGFAAIPPADASPVQAPGHDYRLTQDRRLNAPAGPPLLRPPTA